MTRDAQDPYERFQDASTTPLLDLIVLVISMVSVTGGSLAILLAVGYLAQPAGRSRAWPFLAILAVLAVANVAARAVRARFR